MKKILLKLFIFLLIILLLGGSFIFLIGYGYYSNTIHKKSLASCVKEITDKKNFIPYEQLPKNYINAVISIEDHRYYNHGPVDFIGIFRALYKNVKDKEFEEGGSTITQQVTKNLIFTQDKTLIRKAGEIFAAYDLEKNYSKDEILALYVNSCYFGNGYYGIYDASMGYFKKQPQNLNLEEASMLAGIPNAPSIYAPTVNPDLAKKRQIQVLKAMVEYKYISQEELNTIVK